MPDGDIDLLTRWREGEAEAGQALFERHFDAIYRFFCNKVGRDVDDLVQETFLGCVHSRDRFRADASFRTYLFAVARKQLLRYRDRWRKNNADDDFDAYRVVDVDATPSQVVVDTEQQALLLRALRRLPLDLQIALELFYWEGLKSADVADVLEIPHGTVRSRLRRAREVLQEHLEAIAQTPELMRSTVGDLDGWLRSMQRKVDRAPDPQ